MRVLSNPINASLQLVIVLAGIGLAQAADPIQTTKPQCPKPTQDMAIEGRRAFLRMNCYSCHGMNAHGASMGPNLVGSEANDIREAVIEGEDRGMPSFKKNLCANDIRNLTAYLQLLGTGSEPTFTHWWEDGMPSK